jgi:hypothetical protein
MRFEQPHIEETCAGCWRWLGRFRMESSKRSVDKIIAMDSIADVILTSETGHPSNQ